jgi:hypothetical protein
MSWFTGPIYIVTNRLAPAWLDLVHTPLLSLQFIRMVCATMLIPLAQENPRIHVVSHADIWSDQASLPSFNSAGDHPSSFLPAPFLTICSSPPLHLLSPFSLLRFTFLFSFPPLSFFMHPRLSSSDTHPRPRTTLTTRVYPA